MLVTLSVLIVFFITACSTEGSYTETTIYTPNGTAVTALKISSELSSSQIRDTMHMRQIIFQTHTNYDLRQHIIIVIHTVGILKVLLILIGSILPNRKNIGMMEVILLKPQHLALFRATILLIKYFMFLM